MKTRRIVLCLIALLSLSVLFAACAPTDGAKEDGTPSLSAATTEIILRDSVYTIVYNGNKINEVGVVRDFNALLNAATGLSYERTPNTDNGATNAILVGTLDMYDGYTTLKEETARFAGATLGSFAIAVNGKNVQIVGYDSASLKAGCEFFVQEFCMKDGQPIGSAPTIASDYSKCILFDKNDYFETGKVTGIDSATITADATLSSITVDGEALAGFDGNTLNYTVPGIPYATRYPTVSASPVFSGAIVSVTQASDATGGVATIAVRGRDQNAEGGYNTKTYTVTFELDETAQTKAEVVWRGGADGVVTFVIDDGDHATADFVLEEMLHKYSALRVSYALITNRLATIQTTDDGSEYQMTADGKYVYTANEAEVNFWRSHLAANNYCELLSHSWTHDKWGMNDDGGEQELTDYSGNKTGTKTFPKGHITMELAASKQILIELFSQDARYFVKPGTGMKEYDFYLNLLTGGTIYSAGRNTNKQLNDLSQFRTAYSDINAYMVTATESPDAWNAFIDSAVEEGKWATFCIHRIVVNNLPTTGHYIYQKNADAMFAHANELATQGKLWIATMTEATDYARLRNQATVIAETYRDESVSVTLTATNPPSEFGETFDGISLTVKIAVPDNWNGTVNASNGAVVEVQSDASGNFVYLDMIPSETAVVLTPAN